MNDEERCNTTLGLGIQMEVKREKQLIKQSKRGFWLDLSLPIHPKIEASDHGHHAHEHGEEIDDQDSFSSKIIDEHENEEEDRRTKRSDSSNDNRYHDNTNGSRKKLKLTTEQIALLEDSFKIHSTLNTTQKHELAKKLRLLPRQIEVWFQNRRARTKLKQIEQECILLKKYCETLSDENRRLKKELREVACCSSKLDNHTHRHHHHHQQQQPIPFCIRCPTASTEKRQPCYEIGKTSEGSSREQDNCIQKNVTATM